MEVPDALSTDHGSSASNNAPAVDTAAAVAEAFHFEELDGLFVADSSPSSPADGYVSDSEIPELEGNYDSAQYPTGGHMNLDIVLQQLIHHNNISTIAEDSEDGNEGNLFQDYDPAMDREQVSRISPLERDDDPDDTRRFHLGDDEISARLPTYPSSDLLTEIDFDDFYRDPDYPPVSQTTDTTALDGPDHISDAEEAGGGDFAADPHLAGSTIHRTTYERNLTIDQFIRQWLCQSTVSPFKELLQFQAPKPSFEAANVLDWHRPERIVRPAHYSHHFYDIQQIPWRQNLRVSRSDARALRDTWYTSYHNLEYSPQGFEKILPREEFYFRERAMYTKHKPSIEHFQLRNLMSVMSHNTVQFSHESKLYSWTPAYDDLNCLIDLSSTPVESGFQGPVKISTMKWKHGVSVAGGFCGEYALRADGTEGSGVLGFVTTDPNGITNHIDIIRHRSNGTPVVVFASNDKHLRTFDCEQNRFVSDHMLSRPINCTDTSSDGRLRVVIGDSPEAWVIEADSGLPLRPLRGHKDFGFACAWSPDMLHIATSNQDKTVKIWDVRMWRLLETIDSDVAGYRSLRFSPVGGGPRTLLMSEPADRIVIVNAQTYQTRQVHDFFGEIGGADFTPDGGAIWVANTDDRFGGFMEFERRQWGQQFGLSFSMRREIEERAEHHYPDLPNEWLIESDLDHDERCILSHRERQLRYLRSLSDEEHDDLLL